MIFVRIKQCKFENVSREKRKIITFFKNERVVIFNWFFVKPPKIFQKKEKSSILILAFVSHEKYVFLWVDILRNSLPKYAK